MKIIILGLLLTSCSMFKPPKEKPIVDRYEKMLRCVDRYVDKGVDAELAFKECKNLYRGK